MGARLGTVTSPDKRLEDDSPGVDIPGMTYPGLLLEGESGHTKVIITAPPQLQLCWSVTPLKLEQ